MNESSYKSLNSSIFNTNLKISSISKSNNLIYSSNLKTDFKNHHKLVSVSDSLKV